MSRGNVLVAVAGVLSCLVAGHAWSEELQDPGVGENVRVVLTIRQGNQEPRTFSVVTAGPKVKLSQPIGTVEIDGNEVPMILEFQTAVDRLDEGDCLVSCTAILSMPMVTSTALVRDGAKRSTLQYTDVGIETQVRLRLGQEIAIAKDPEKTLLLRLEAVE